QSAKGTLKPKSSFGVVVTLNPTAATDSGKVRFKFEISCWDDSRSVEGVTVATAYVNRSRGSITGAEGVRRGSVDGTTSNLDNVHESVHRYKAVDTRRTSPSVVLFTAAVLLLCLAVLFSPSEYAAPLPPLVHTATNHSRAFSHSPVTTCGVECTAADQTSPVSVFPTVQPSHQMVAAFVLADVPEWSMGRLSCDVPIPCPVQWSCSLGSNLKP
ncbi:hypothetical protein SARC_08050, partial [Sphaeroforma arctica JP610]